MGILSRMSRLCKADVHGIMDQMEDKGLLLKQYVREMEAELKAKENRLAQIALNGQQMERDLGQRREEIRNLEEDLDLAVRKEEDDIARMLIRKRRTVEATCEQLALGAENMKDEKDRLSETLARQRLQFEQLKLKAASYCQMADQRAIDSAAGMEGGISGGAAPAQEEIELELLRRKEALQKGGAQ